MADNSILAVDFGNIHTRAVLIDLVEGAFRLVARADERTTAGFPINDVGVGLRRVVNQLSSLTGRRLISDDGRIITPESSDRTGVDLFLTTASVGRPLRTVVIGLFPDMSIASVLRAAAGTYITVVDVISAADQRSAEDHLNAIALANPDLIVIAGGTEDGARDPILEMARLTRLALRLMRRSLPPTVLYAGNSALRAQIAALFENAANVIFAENVRPSVRRENVEDARAQLAVAFNAFTEQRGMGFDEVGYQSRLGVLPTAQSYDSIVRYLGATGGKGGRGILALDLGSAVSTMSASVNGVVSTTIRTDIGLGHRADTTLESTGIEAIRAWLPFIASDDEISGYALNKTLRPANIPLTRRALFLEHALMRAAMVKLLDAARPLWTPNTALDDLRAPMPPLERVIGAGAGLNGTGRAGMTAMLMLDAVQPIGVTRLQADSIALIPALGALARVNPTAVVQVLDAGGLEELGTAISISGKPRRGRTVASVTVTKESGEVEKYTIEGGKLHILPLSIGVRAKVRVRVRGTGLNIGGRGGIRLDVVGGSAGLVIDARGRPLPLENALKNRAAQIVGWYADATGDEPIPIPEDWLTQRATEADVTSVLKHEAQDRDRIETVVPAAAESKKGSARKRQNERKGKGGKQEPEAPAAAPKPFTTDEDMPDHEDSIDDLRNLFS